MPNQSKHHNNKISVNNLSVNTHLNFHKFHLNIRSNILQFLLNHKLCSNQKPHKLLKWTSHLRQSSPNKFLFNSKHNLRKSLTDCLLNNFTLHSPLLSQILQNWTLHKSNHHNYSPWMLLNSSILSSSNFNIYQMQISHFKLLKFYFQIKLNKLCMFHLLNLNYLRDIDRWCNHSHNHNINNSFRVCLNNISSPNNLNNFNNNPNKYNISHSNQIQDNRRS